MESSGLHDEQNNLAVAGSAGSNVAAEDNDESESLLNPVQR